MRVIEQFRGFVDSIDGDNALITLTSDTGETLHGVYPATALTDLGITERRSFSLATVQADDDIEIHIAAIPEAELTADELVELHSKLRSLCTDELNGDD